MPELSRGFGPATKRERAWAFVIFLHYIVYEVFFFFYPEVYPVLGRITALWKVLIPCLLFVALGLPNVRLLRAHRALTKCLVFFVIFLVWALVPSLGSVASISEWLKTLPRFAFFFAAGLVFIRAPRIAVATAKLIVGWALLAVAQYVVLFVTGAAESPEQYAWGGLSAGPWGVLGNVTSVMHFPGIGIPIPRLHGFWNEPSNASASMFGACFLARWLFMLTNDRRWRWAGWLCLGGGLACLSNAGYLAVGAALLAAAALKLRLGDIGVFKRTILAGLAAALIAGALWGRVYVAQLFPDNEVLRAVAGLRLDPEDVASGGLDTAYGGRIELLSDTWTTVKAHPLGIGLQPNGGDGVPLSSSAPVMWFLFTGPIGLSLLLCRDWWIWRIIFRAGSRSALVFAAGQAFIVVAVQQVSYGSWMNPLFFVTGALVFATASWIRRGLVPIHT